MKKTIALALIGAAASLASSGAMAQQFYVSGAVGTGHVEVDCTGVSQCDDSATAGKVTAGYAISNALSAEIGYINFGKAEAADSGVRVALKPTALTLGLAYTVKLAPQWDMAVRGGVARVETKLSASVSGVGSGSDSENKTTGYVGLGFGYALSKQVKIEAGADFSRAEYSGEKADIRAITIGARYAF